MSEILQPWIDRWALTPDGVAFSTPYTKSWLQPVRRAGMAAMLKVAGEPEEVRGAAVLSWWAGRGAAPVLEHEGPALLMERAQGGRSLLEMSVHDDDETTAILCSGLEALHSAPGAPPAGTTVPLRAWFAALAPVAQAQGGLYAQAHATAEALFADPLDERVLHGDMHHENLLDFGPRGWLAIDPKGLVGERGYDFANIFCNPDKSENGPQLATQPGRLARRTAIAAERSGIPQRRLLQWVLAYAGLSAAWIFGDGDDPVFDLTMCELALAELAA